MNKQELLAWMQDMDVWQARKYRCRVLAETLCSTMNIVPHVCNLIMLLGQGHCRSNIEALAEWVDGRIACLEGLSDEEQLICLQNELTSMLMELMPG